MVFGATAEDGPLRAELFSPIIGGNPHGRAISLIQLLGASDDSPIKPLLIPVVVFEIVLVLCALGLLHVSHPGLSHEVLDVRFAVVSEEVYC